MPKTATIKLRLTEAEKTAWEAQATADGVSLSSLIRHRMNHPMVRADGGLVTAPGMMRDLSLKRQFALNPPRQGCPSNGKPCNCTGACMRPVGAPAQFPSIWSGGASGPSLPILSTTADTPGERRSTQCEHGRPQYVFCATCDGA